MRRCLLLKNNNMKRYFHKNMNVMTGLNRSLKNVKPIQEDKTSMMFCVKNVPGSLQTALSYFSKNNINLTHLSSKPSKQVNAGYDFVVSFEKPPNDSSVQALQNDLNSSNIILHAEVSGPEIVPWFPTRPDEVDLFAHLTLDAGADLQSDHPGFHDKEYRQRRAQLADIALNYKYGETIPNINYNENEIKTWGTIFDKLVPLQKKYACKEHVEILDELFEECKFSQTNIPQLSDVSNFLKTKTGFTLRPVSGLFSPRHFFYGLAFRIFCSTQYIRHHSKPLYTPEPDIVHELLGHAPMLANPEFADFSQAIGLASIGASDEQITEIARCYWFSVEFGLCQENGQRKAYGAGLLSSFGELEYSMSDEPEIRPWEPKQAALQDYPITTYQPIYFQAENFTNAKEKMSEFADSLHKPFHASFDPLTQTINVDRALAYEEESAPERLKQTFQQDAASL